MFRGISIKAVLIGVVIDIGGSLIAGLFLGITLAIVAVSQGVPAKNLTANLTETMQTVPMLLVSGALGASFTMLGAFVTGWVAKQAEVKNAAMMGTLSVLGALPFMGGYPIWYNVMGVIFTLAAAFLGGYVAQAILNRKPQQPPPPTA